MSNELKTNLKPEELAELLLNCDFEVLSQAFQIARRKEPFKIMRAFDKRMSTTP
jgi:hypothetical protein